MLDRGEPFLPVHGAQSWQQQGWASGVSGELGFIEEATVRAREGAGRTGRMLPSSPGLRSF